MVAKFTPGQIIKTKIGHRETEFRITSVSEPNRFGDTKVGVSFTYNGKKTHRQVSACMNEMFHICFYSSSDRLGNCEGVSVYAEADLN